MKDIKETQVVKHFLKRFPKSTQIVYLGNVKQFFEHICKNPDEYIKDPRRITDRNELLDLLELYEQDIMSFMQSMKDKDTPPKTMLNKMYAVKKLFLVNRINLDAIFWEDVQQMTNGRARVSEDYIPSQKELQEILQHGTVKSRAFFLMNKTIYYDLKLKILCNIKKMGIVCFYNLL